MRDHIDKMTALALSNGDLKMTDAAIIRRPVCETSNPPFIYSGNLWCANLNCEILIRHRLIFRNPHSRDDQIATRPFSGPRIRISKFKSRAKNGFHGLYFGE